MKESTIANSTKGGGDKQQQTSLYARTQVQSIFHSVLLYLIYKHDKKEEDNVKDSKDLLNDLVDAIISYGLILLQTPESENGNMLLRLGLVHQLCQSLLLQPKSNFGKNEVIFREIIDQIYSK